MRELRKQRQPGGSTSQEGRCPPPPSEEPDSRDRGICKELAERNNCRSQPEAPNQHWLFSSTWFFCSGTRSSPGCRTGSAWLPAPVCPAQKGTSAFRNFSPVFAIGSR